MSAGLREASKNILVRVYLYCGIIFWLKAKGLALKTVFWDVIQGLWVFQQLYGKPYRVGAGANLFCNIHEQFNLYEGIFNLRPVNRFTVKH